MNNVGLDRNDSLKYEMYNNLINKKNMMFYDGFSDGLDEDVRFKFFYSSPYDALEFINIDIYGNEHSVYENEENINFYGIIYITREKMLLDNYKFNNNFGQVVIRDIIIRDVEKQIVNLYINKMGMKHILNAIEYFEDNLCIK